MLLPEFTDFGAVFGGDDFQVFDGVALGLMRAFKPLDSLDANLLDQAGAIPQQVAGLAHVAVTIALQMHIERLEAELWGGCSCSEIGRAHV